MWTTPSPSRTPQRQLGSLSLVGGISTPTRGGRPPPHALPGCTHPDPRKDSGTLSSATRVPPPATDASKKRRETTGIWTVRVNPRLIVSRRGFYGGWECLERSSQDRRATFGTRSWFRRRLGTPPWAPQGSRPGSERPRVGPALAAARSCSRPRNRLKTSRFRRAPLRTALAENMCLLMGRSWLQPQKGAAPCRARRRFSRKPFFLPTMPRCHFCDALACGSRLNGAVAQRIVPHVWQRPFVTSRQRRWRPRMLAGSVAPVSVIRLRAPGGIIMPRDRYLAPR